MQEIVSSETQSEEGYACFLSYLMVFASLFDERGLSPLSRYQQNILLRNLADLLQFPPAVRCMYSLLNRRTPPYEDCAALAQCLYLFGQALGANLAQDFDLRNSRIIFESLHAQLNIEAAESSNVALDVLEGFEHCSLSCNATNKTAAFGISLNSRNASVLVEKKVAEYYINGPLKMTHYTGRGITLASERLSIYSGGRFPGIIHSRAPVGDHRRQINLLTLLNNNNLDFSLAVIAPKDLKSAAAPKLSRDLRGRMCVYTGMDLGECGSPGHE